MTIRESQRRQRQRKDSEHEREHEHEHPRNRVLSFKQWCQLNAISEATGRRILAAGKCKYLQLNERRIGIRLDHNAEYQAACVRGGE